MADGFAYYPCHSTSVVFYIDNANDNNLELFNLRPQYHPFLHGYNLLNHFSRIPRPFSILSSSVGCILCRDRFNSYHVINPFSYHIQIPNPPRPHNTTTLAVISFECDGGFYVICAVDESQGHYTFDVFHSNANFWSSAQGPIDLDEGEGKILSNTGISCHRMAFWLTEGPQHPVVVKHDPGHHEAFQRNIMEDGIPLIRFEPWMRLQLGRIRHQLGMVIVDGVVAQLFMLDRTFHRWYCMGRTSVGNIGGEHVISLQPLRFESCKMEVLFSAVGQSRRCLVLWESDDFPFRMTRLVELPWSENASAAADGAVPYVFNPHT